MATQRFFRLSGLALLIGGVVSFVTSFGGAFFYGQTTSYANQPLYIVTNVVLAAATILALLGLPGVYASRAQGFGVVGLVGAALIFTVGCIFGVFLNLVNAIVIPYLATDAPNLANNSNGPPGLFVLFIVGSIFSAVGPVLLAIPLLRGRVSPRWPAFVLLAGAVYGVVSFFVTNGPGSSLISNLLSAISPMILFVALAALGFQTWSHPTLDADGITDDHGESSRSSTG
jgi:hypothetical protein